MFEEQIKQSEHTIAEKSRQLDAIKLERIRVEEATTECTQEIERRVALVVEWGAVGDVLLEFGKLVQRKSHLAEMLNGPNATDGKRSKGRTVDQSNYLRQDMEDCATEKAESLRSQVLEVKQSLEDIRSRSFAATTILVAPTTKPKRKKRARK